MQDMLQCTVTFSTIESLCEAVDRVLIGSNKDLIISIKPKLKTNLLSLSLNLCVEDEFREEGFLPLIGEV
jgi:phage-related protein